MNEDVQNDEQEEIKNVRELSQEELDEIKIGELTNSNDLLYCYDYHKNFQHKNNNELEKVLREKLELTLKAEKLIGSRVKYIPAKEFIETLIKYYPMINVGISRDDCHQMFYDYDNQIWSEDIELFRELIISFCNTNQLNRTKDNIQDVMAGMRKIYFEDLHDKEKIKIDNGKFTAKPNFNNGQYDCQTEELKITKPSDLIMFRRNYDLPDTLNEEYKREFDEYFNQLDSHYNQEKIKAFKQIMLSIMLGYKPHNQMNMIQGNAGSGKSTFLDIGLRLLVYNMKKDHSSKRIVKFSLSDFDKEDALANIGRAEMLFSSDNNDKIVINNIETFKSMLSGEIFSYFVKFKNRGYNIFDGPMIEVMNNIPTFASGTDKEAVIHRIHFMTINKQMRNTENEIENYADYLTEGDKLGHLARYLLDEVEPFTQFCYNENDKLQEELDESDTVYQFVKDLKDNNFLHFDYLPNKRLYQAYQSFSKDFNPSAAIKSHTKFIRDIQNYLFKEDYQFVNKPRWSTQLNNKFDEERLSDIYHFMINEKVKTKYFEKMNYFDLHYNIMTNDDADRLYYYLKKEIMSKEDAYLLGLLESAYSDNEDKINKLNEIRQEFLNKYS